MYYIFIIKYLVVLYWAWCSYHSYVRKAFRVMILWHHSGPFGSSSSHFSCFFKGVRPSFGGLMCCPSLFRTLGFDCSCNSLSFPIGWSPYSFWCGGTCRNRYLSLPSRITRYPCDVTWGHLTSCFAFRKSSSAILFSITVLFSGPTTRARIYFAFNKCSFRSCASMFSFLCLSNNRGLVINLF